MLQEKKKDKRFIEERSPGGTTVPGRKSIQVGAGAPYGSALRQHRRSGRRGGGGVARLRRDGGAPDLGAAPGGLRLKSRVWRRGVNQAAG